MARKGHQQRNGLDRNTSSHKVRVSESCTGSLQEKKETVEAHEGKIVDGENLPNGSPFTQRKNRKKHVREGKESNQKSVDTPIDGKMGLGINPDPDPSSSISSNQNDPDGDVSTSNASNVRGESGASLGSDHSLKDPKDSLGCSEHGLREKDVMEGSGSPDNVIGRSLGASALSILMVASEWLERQKPLLTKITTILLEARDYIRLKTVQAYPLVCRWLVHLGNLMFLVSLVWLDCSLRGLNSFMRLGTTSFFAVIWCSILSVIAMIGILKFLMIMAIAAVLAVFVGFTLATLVIALSAIVVLWIYGSFWTTGLVIFLGGMGFGFKCERFALLITTLYSIYSARVYVGWLGLFLGLNLSFISSDVLIHFLKNNVNEHRRSYRAQEQTAGMQGQSGSFYSESMHTSPSETTSGRETDRSAGVPSTSGADAELTSEDEVIRLLNCTDHYSALGLLRYENIDIALLKREYRKKAMLVHPDKNMGDEKAAEAFKKLQNAYEVLLDSLKREAYNDELKREELLNWFRGLQSSQMSGRHGPFASGFPHSEGDGKDPLGEFRRIACKKCRDFHIWIHINRSKSRARWCQECKDFHQAKDGDGWVEQSSKPFFFGMLQKVDAPSAYVCAESRIYDATEWFICQGMRCPANTHKPSFHVNTNVTSKHGATKGSGSGQKGGNGMPSANMEENMTEEEFWEWLQNAMQSGIFEAAGTGTSTGGNPSTDSPSSTTSRNWTKNSSGSGSGNGNGNGNGNGSSSSTKKKRKGKKQW